MVKLVLLSSNLFDTFGGYEKIILTLFQNLAQKKFEFTIISVAYTKKLLSNKILDEFKNYNIHRFSPYKNNFVRRLSIILSKISFRDFLIDNGMLKEYFKKLNFNPDLILVTDPFLVLSARNAVESLNLNTKIVYWDHAQLINFLKYGKTRFLLRKEITKALNSADAFLAISTGIRNIILSYNPNAKVFTVFNPISKYEGKLVRRPNNPIFLYVGRIEDHQKNISFMLKGLSKIKNKWKLIIIGEGPDKNKLINLAKKLKIEDKIEWKGFKKDPYENLEEVTALLLTSRWEGLPTVLIEAIQRGIPVISSNCSTGPEDIVISGVNGYLYEDGNLNEFVSLMEKIINGKLKFGTPEEIAKTAEKFDADIVIANIKNAIKTIVSN